LWQRVTAQGIRFVGIGIATGNLEDALGQQILH
jgi:hypothetical protein